LMACGGAGLQFGGSFDASVEADGNGKACADEFLGEAF
jgi:hypothetical protein